MTDNILLQGIVGSRAYGLATATSDTDRLGVFAAPTDQFHGLHPPTGKRATHVTTAPDSTLHEAAKFAALALNANPTVMELLWLPGHLYEVRTSLGSQLIDLRHSFLSAKRVRDAYLGYATQQLVSVRRHGRFPDVPRDRIAKHARHLMRLIEQSTVLWSTGMLVLEVTDVEKIRDFGDRVALGDTDLAHDLLTEAECVFAGPTVLPLCIRCDRSKKKNEQA